MVLCIVNVKQYKSNLSLQLKTSSQYWLQIFISHLEQKLGHCVTYGLPILCWPLCLVLKRSKSGGVNKN